MCIALCSKIKIPITDNSLSILDYDDLNCAAWERFNHTVHSWLLNSIYDSIYQTIAFHKNSIDVWNDFKERLAIIDCVRVATLRAQLNNLKQGSRSLTTYRPILTCTCSNPYRCEAMRSARHYIIEEPV